MGSKMRAAFLLAFLTLAVLMQNALAQEPRSDVAQMAFDSALISQDERRLLQTSLAMSGKYNGLIDGVWGPASQRALVAWAAQTSGAAQPTFHDIAVLMSSTLPAIVENEWQFFYFETFDISLIVPKAAMRDGSPSVDFINFEHSASSLKYSVTVGPIEQVAKLHAFALGADGQTVAAYTVRKQNVAVTSVTDRNNELLYVRSDYRGDRWATVMLSASKSDRGLFGMVTGSIRPGYVAPLVIEENGLLMGFLIELLDAKDIEKPVTPGRIAGAEPPSPAKSAGAVVFTGTGISVSETGHVLTNRHVVEDCLDITVGGIPAELLASNTDIDLALLQTAGLASQRVASFRSAPAALNSDVTVVGYPLAGLLGGVNVTRGSVSSLSGIRGDLSTMQITAPVQPGNSGGPVVAEDATVVGVVVARLNDEKTSEDYGALPQNVNFAIRGEIAQLFLAANGVLATRSDPGPHMDPEELAATAAGFTVYIECRQ